MKLRPFVVGLSRFVSTTYSFSTRMGLGVVTLRPTADVRDLILVGDGTPDNYVLAILAYHLNGRKVVGIAKHEEMRGLSVLRDVRTYVEAAKRLRTLLLPIDRDEMTLEAIADRARSLVKGAAIKDERAINGGRVREMELCYGGREFRLVLLVNDFELKGARKHTIESHLLHAAKEILGCDLVRNLLKRAMGDPKSAWAMLDKNRQYHVYRHMVERRALVERAFPQHIKALKLLDE